MPRYKLIIEYDGGPFVGWQRQPNGPTVQALLEEAIFAMSGERVAVQGRGAPIQASMRLARWHTSIS